MVMTTIARNSKFTFSNLFKKYPFLKTPEHERLLEFCIALGFTQYHIVSQVDAEIAAFQKEVGAEWVDYNILLYLDHDDEAFPVSCVIVPKSQRQIGKAMTVENTGFECVNLVDARGSFYAKMENRKQGFESWVTIQQSRTSGITTLFAIDPIPD